jgi:hypothetical protein
LFFGPFLFFLWRSSTGRFSQIWKKPKQFVRKFG